MSEAFDQDRAALWHLLGGSPRNTAPRVLSRNVAQSPFPGTRLERLLLDLNGVEPVPALFLAPERSTNPPLVVYAHAHGNRYALGKSELLLGRPALQPEPYGLALTQRGYAVLAIDAWLFEERQRAGGEALLARSALYRGDTVWGMMLRDTHAAIGCAVASLGVDASRIAILGLSMGASMAWWSSALDPRITVCVDLCCMTDFETAIETGGIDGHGIYYVVPGLLPAFSTARINALSVPRPHLSLNGRDDPLTPPAGLARVDRAMKDAYDRAGAADRWRMHIYPCGHQETPEMRRSALDFLDRWL